MQSALVLAFSMLLYILCCFSGPIKGATPIVPACRLVAPPMAADSNHRRRSGNCFYYFGCIPIGCRDLSKEPKGGVLPSASYQEHAPKNKKATPLKVRFNRSPWGMSAITRDLLHAAENNIIDIRGPYEIVLHLVTIPPFPYSISKYTGQKEKWIGQL